jgi:hypothetical protein
MRLDIRRRLGSHHHDPLIEFRGRHLLDVVSPGVSTLGARAANEQLSKYAYEIGIGRVFFRNPEFPVRCGHSGGRLLPKRAASLGPTPWYTHPVGSLEIRIGTRPLLRQLAGALRQQRQLLWADPVIDLLARPERFELPTPWFVARYSIQLSYGRAAVQGRICSDRGSVARVRRSLRPPNASLTTGARARSGARILPHPSIASSAGINYQFANCSTVYGWSTAATTLHSSSRSALFSASGTDGVGSAALPTVGT